LVSTPPSSDQSRSTDAECTGKAYSRSIRRVSSGAECRCSFQKTLCVCFGVSCCCCIVEDAGRAGSAAPLTGAASGVPPAAAPAPRRRTAGCRAPPPAACSRRSLSAPSPLAGCRSAPWASACASYGGAFNCRPCSRRPDVSGQSLSPCQTGISLPQHRRPS